MRLVMMATGPFAAPTFQGLLQTHHDVAALVTGPIRPQHARREKVVYPLRALAVEHGKPIFDPENINVPEAQSRLRLFAADLLVVCDYGQILSPVTLACARLGGVNLHGSLLPKYRGAAPIQWAIYHGETETGVTVIHMTPQVDAGPCIAQARIPIGPDETAGELEPRLAEAGAWLVRRTIDNLEAGELEALPQDPSLASKAPRLKKTDGLIDWTHSAECIRNQVRAMDPWPKTYSYLYRTGAPPLRLIVGPVDVAPGVDAPPGVVVEAQGRLVVACGGGGVALGGVQPAGKRMLSAEEFIRGYHVRPGDHFGGEPGAATP